MTAEPVNVSAGTVVLDPVNVSAGTVRFGAVALHAFAVLVPCAILVAAQLPVVAVAEFVPSGVIVTVPFVPAAVTLCVCDDSFAAVGTPAGQEIVDPPCVCEDSFAAVGTPAGHEIVSAGIVPEVPVNAGTPTGQEIVGPL